MPFGNPNCCGTDGFRLSIPRFSNRPGLESDRILWALEFGSHSCSLFRSTGIHPMPILANPPPLRRPKRWRWNFDALESSVEGGQSTVQNREGRTLNRLQLPHPVGPPGPPPEPWNQTVAKTGSSLPRPMELERHRPKKASLGPGVPIPEHIKHRATRPKVGCRARPGRFPSLFVR